MKSSIAIFGIVVILSLSSCVFSWTTDTKKPVPVVTNTSSWEKVIDMSTGATLSPRSLSGSR